MSDITAPEVRLWRRLEDRARRVFACYGYEELRTPILERVEVFRRSIGDATEVVQKEMYAFTDRGGREVALRPEGTAGAIRHLAGRGEEGLNARVFYIGPMFRCERPQAGRKRQFHQVGVEATGAPNPAADAECIALQLDLLDAWGLSGAKLLINTRGTPADQKAVAARLRELLSDRRDALCEDCRRRIEENVLRVLDCKKERCRAVVAALPPVESFMEESSREYLREVIDLLAGMGIEAEKDPSLVRGLDYYVHTVWEITHDALGAQNALAGGGRYEITFGRKTLPGVGFAMGLERVIAALEACGVRAEDLPAGGGVWLVSLGEEALRANMKLARTLRRRNVPCGMDLAPGRMKGQMRRADRHGAAWTVIRGEDELARGTVVLKDMKEGTQEELGEAEAVERLARLYAGPLSEE